MRLPAPHAPAHTPEPAQAAREPRGAPDVTAVHVPGEPETLQASHWPLQATLQHTPSTQRALWHCEFAVQAVPLGRAAVQPPLTQYGAPLTQLLALVQEVRHAEPPALQVKLSAQALVLALGQLPAPLQAAAAVSVEP